MGGAKNSVKLSSVLFFVSERSRIDATNKENYVTTDNMLQDFKGIRRFDGETTAESGIQYKEKDILLSNIRPYLKKLWFSDTVGVASPDVIVMRVITADLVNEKFIYLQLRTQKFIDYVMLDVSGVKMPRGKKAHIEKYSIILPSIEEQNNIIKTVEEYESEISTLQSRLSELSGMKNKVLEKYL